MKCRALPKKFLLLPLFLLIFMLISSVKASPYYITRPTYFPSKSSSYITFSTMILPISFNTLYKDAQTKWYFNDVWITTSIDLTVTAWFIDDWLNYTTSSGTQEIHNGVKPSLVLFDGIKQSEGDTWSYSDGTVTITPSGTDVGIFWGEVSENGEGPSIFTSFFSNIYVSISLMSLCGIVTVAAFMVLLMKGDLTVDVTFFLIVALIVITICVVITLMIITGFADFFV